MIEGIECAFVGTVARHAEIKTVQASGRTFLSMGVTTGRDDKQQYVSVLAWRDTFTDLVTNLVKGTRVYIEGRLELRHWQGTDGPQYGLSVSASVIQPGGLIGAKKPKAPPKARANGKAKADPHRPLETGAGAKPFDDALPF